MEKVPPSEKVSNSRNVKQEQQGEDGDKLQNTTFPQTKSPEENPAELEDEDTQINSTTSQAAPPEVNPSENKKNKQGRQNENTGTPSQEPTAPAGEAHEVDGQGNAPSSSLETPSDGVEKENIEPLGDKDTQINSTTSQTAPPEVNLSENKKNKQGRQNENTGTPSKDPAPTVPPTGEAHEVDGQGKAPSSSLENGSDGVEKENIVPFGATTKLKHNRTDSVSTGEKTTGKVNQSESKDGDSAEGENEHEDSSSCEDTSRSKGKGRERNMTSQQRAAPKKQTIQEMEKKESEVENIGPVPDETTKSLLPLGGCLVGLLVVVLAVGAAVLYSPPTESPRQENKVDVFLRQMDKVRTQFPNQRAEFWKRSTIHLQRHLQTAQPTEPVSLMLTAGRRAETTLHCLAHGLASAFSSAHNASILHINGTNQARRDSDQVKLDIDRKLQGAFEGDKPVAVIHRFEELPPGSTLIFYRYCDHENAAYKETFLIFTVLLEENEDIPAKIHLSAVEEMVDDHLQKKFLSHGHPVSFDRMDVDKYGGLWSRISHLILPVAAEERIETKGCRNT